MRCHQRKNVARPVQEDVAVTFGRKALIAVEPSTRRARVIKRGVVDAQARRFDRDYARSKRRSRSIFVSAHNERSTQTMAEDKVWVIGKYPISFGRGIATIR